MWEDHLENTKALCAGSPTSFLHEDATSFRNSPTVGNLSAIANLFLFWFPFAWFHAEVRLLNQISDLNSEAKEEVP